VRTLLTQQQPPPWSVMPSPWRSSPAATTHCLDHIFVPYLSRTCRCPTTVLRLAVCLSPWCSSPRAERRFRGGGVENAVVGVVGRPPRLRPPSRSSSRRCALTDLPPVVRAYLHVAPPRSGRGASFPAPAGCHGHECCLLRTDLDSTSSAQIVMAGWRGEGRRPAGCTVAACGADAGIFSSVRPPHPSCPSSIMVGDGSSSGHFCGFCSRSFSSL
jgi:hypothetical protein